MVCSFHIFFLLYLTILFLDKQALKPPPAFQRKADSQSARSLPAFLRIRSGFRLSASRYFLDVYKRQGAASAVAAELLAKKDARVLGIIGAGAQGRSHLEGMLCVRPGLKEVRVYDIRPEAAASYKAEMEARFGINVTVAATAREAAEECDIICTLTPSKEAYPVSYTHLWGHVYLIWCI